MNFPTHLTDARGPVTLILESFREVGHTSESCLGNPLPGLVPAAGDGAAAAALVGDDVKLQGHGELSPLRCCLLALSAGPSFRRS